MKVQFDSKGVDIIESPRFLNYHIRTNKINKTNNNYMKGKELKKGNILYG